MRAAAERERPTLDQRGRAAGLVPTVPMAGTTEHQQRCVLHRKPEPITSNEVVEFGLFLFAGGEYVGRLSFDALGAAARKDPAARWLHEPRGCQVRTVRPGEYRASLLAG